MLRGEVFEGHASQAGTVITHDGAHRFDEFPLTDMQQAYWVGRHKTLELGNVAIHSYLEIEIAGLNVERLEWAWNAVIERHDMLRAVIHRNGRQQVLSDVGPYRIAKHHYASGSECETGRAGIRERLSHQVFDPERWPLFELLVSEGPGCGTVLHLSIDGVLLDIVVRECLQLYESSTADLPALNITFRDYVMAEQSLRTQPTYQDSLKWWRERLAKLPGPPDLPLCKRPNTLTNPRFQRRSGSLEAPVWSSLRRRALQAGLTAPCLLLTVYAKVVSEWSSNAHFAINVPQFDRRPVHPEVDQLVGEFASFTLVVCDFSLPATPAERCRVMQKELWDVLAHSDVSGVTLIRERIRLLGRGSAMFPVVFTANPTLGFHRPKALSQATRTRVVHAITQTPQVWLDFQIGEEQGVLSYNLDAVDDLFPPGMLDEATLRFGALLRTLADVDSCWQQTIL
jgi:hypothetical protein